MAQLLLSPFASAMGARSGRRAERGFTLAEMLAVVAMVGILATLAVVGVRKYVFAAKSSEAMSMVSSIAAHQESYRDETGFYLDVTSGDYTPLYPVDPTDESTPGTSKYSWTSSSHADFSQWRLLGADPGGPVSFGYACSAGAAGSDVPSPTTQDLNLPSPASEPWYVVKAVADHDADGVAAVIVASSFTREVYVENEDE